VDVPVPGSWFQGFKRIEGGIERGAFARFENFGGSDCAGEGDV